MHPRQNQISTVIHHQLQILRFLLLVPSDPLIAWGHLPSRRRPQQTGQYLLSTPPGAHQVAEICSYRHAVGQVVIPLDQLGPQPALAAALDHPQLQWCELPRASFQNGLWSARLAQSNAARSLRARIPYRRQGQPASVALTLPLPQEFFLFCRFPWDARRKGRFLGLCGPLCPCAWLVDSGFSLNTSVPL